MERVPVTSPFWEALDDAGRATLRRAGRLRTFRPGGEPLTFEGDVSTHVTIIMEGWAKVISPTGSGREVVLAVRGPGDLVGEVSAMFDGPRTATVQALVPIKALNVPAARFRAFLDENPRTWWPLVATIVDRMGELGNRLRVHAGADGTCRLAHLLVHLAELSLRYTEPGPGGRVPILPQLSQADLGSWVDASRETAARGFGELRDKGLVATAYKRVTVLDLPGLRAFADGCAADS
ncbi:cAMP-binding domain of CRP or a regulatory subunit of cAMP-dependent protein kinases [Thermomonospora echinospora]|uniref:cAMP-binding domain of CRP or a regulatory subunit of cAMP-dependent protein kinases n=1 Tax=Thermomonospora echinospora TaxID=1992 RepID=A0A1H6BYN6_9ACTN|nr:cAMP-binding domain of CRP or a regulatory subunit of cAMP-dependent protein kinases [Thermomonospora echinospora]